MFKIDAALRDAEVGNYASAKKGVKSALAFSSGRDIEIVAALVLARSGDTAGAKALVEELQRKYPTNSFLKLYWVPTIKAAVELKRGNPSQALASLAQATPYEMGQAGLFVNSIYPAYVRGQVYLKMHNGTAALAEFQKMLDHRFHSELRSEWHVLCSRPVKKLKVKVLSQTICAYPRARTYARGAIPAVIKG